MASHLHTYEIHITGKVQGVWYRASAKDKALSLGLKGTIQNESDGSVMAIVQGPIHDINQFIEWCKEGPPLAQVSKVTVSEITNDVLFDDFDISRSK